MKPFLKDVRIVRWNIPMPVLLWFALAVIAVTLELSRSSIGNFSIYRGVFWHSLHQQDLYVHYPAEYGDVNLYGPLFSIFIMPFAVLPLYIGCFLWAVANAALLFVAIRTLKLPYKDQLGILLIAGIEMMTAIHNVQFNPMLTAFLLLSFTLVEKEKDFWATFFIAAGFLIKIYGIAGIAFFCFSRHKVKFVLSFLFWLAVLFCLPMLIASPSFIIHAYKRWPEALIVKNSLNVSPETTKQDISVMGMIRRIFGKPDFPNLYVLLPAAIAYGAILLRFSQYQYQKFRFLYASLLLIGVVIFSSSAESSTYVIAMTGVGLWFMVEDKGRWVIAMLVLAMILTSLSPTDLIPFYLKEHFIYKYSLKALPCFIIWLFIANQLLVKNFALPKNDCHV